MSSAYWQKGVGKVRKEISKGKNLYVNIVEDIAEQPPIRDHQKFKDLQMYIM